MMCDFMYHLGKTGHGTNVLKDYLREVADIVPCWSHMEQALVFGLSPDSPDVPTDEASQARGEVLYVVEGCEGGGGEGGSFRGSNKRIYTLSCLLC